MANEVGQADVLRALGRFLDEQGATGIEIRNHEVFLAITWTEAGSGGRRAYQEKDLEGLREQAIAMRKGIAGGTPKGSLGELLRTLGQDLDKEGIEMAGIVQEEDGFRVSGQVAGRYYNELFLTSQLLDESNDRMLQRSPIRPKPAHFEEPFERVRVGLDVLDRDGQRLGRVGEIQGRSIKIGTPLFRRDYWISAELISSAETDGQVVLNVARSEMDQHKNPAPVA